MRIWLGVRDNHWKRWLIPDVPKGKRLIARRRARVRLASWCGKSAPRLRSVAGLRGRSATLGLRHGPDSYGRQQWGIFRNGQKPDGAIPREGGRLLGCKPLFLGKKHLTVPKESASANSVPAAAVIRRMQALSGMIGRKASVGGFLSSPSNPRAQPWTGGGNYQAGVR